MFVLQSLVLLTETAVAQSNTSTNKWNFLVEPYLMFPNLKGTTGLGTLPDAEVNADPGEVFSHFKMGAILYFEMSNNKWAYTSDITYLNLDEDVTPGTLINSGNANLKQFLWELGALRKYASFFEAGIGGRLNSIKTSLDLETKNVGGGTTTNSKSGSKTWVDPILITRIKNPAGSNFLYQLRADVGGFGIGSDFTWQLQAYAGYRFSDLFHATAGYKFISADYNKGSGDDRFLYDVDTFGPVVRLGFNF